MTDRPLVSVLTPSFQQGRWLPDNLRSVASQTYPNIEHIVMDGGSTDNTVEALRRAGPNVRWRSEPDRGQAHAINKAFAESNGAIIGWINSDDAYFDPTAVAAVVQAFRERPDVDVIYGHAALVNADGLILQMIWLPPYHRRLLRLYGIIQPAVFVRRSALGAMMVDDAYDFCMDRELWLRLSRGHSFARIDRILAIDRHQPGRKVLTRHDLAEADYVHLRASYGISSKRYVSRIPMKGVKVAFRLAGLRLVPRAAGPYAFDAVLDSKARLFVRQMLWTRAMMPIRGRSRQESEAVTS